MKRRQVESSVSPCLVSLSYPVMLASPAATEPVHLWNLPGVSGSFHNSHSLQLLQSDWFKTFCFYQTQNKQMYLNNSMKEMRKNIKYSLFVLFSVEFMRKRICKWSHVSHMNRIWAVEPLNVQISTFSTNSVRGLVIISHKKGRNEKRLTRKLQLQHFIITYTEIITVW